MSTIHVNRRAYPGGTRRGAAAYHAREYLGCAANVQTRRFWVPSERRWVRLTVSTKGLRTIDKQGIEKVLADMRRRGERV